MTSSPARPPQRHHGPWRAASRALLAAIIVTSSLAGAAPATAPSIATGLGASEDPLVPPVDVAAPRPLLATTPAAEAESSRAIDDTLRYTVSPHDAPAAARSIATEPGAWQDPAGAPIDVAAPRPIHAATRLGAEADSTAGAASKACRSIRGESWGLDNSLIVTLRDPAAAGNVSDIAGYRVVARIGSLNIFLVEVDDRHAARESLYRDPSVLSVAPNVPISFPRTPGYAIPIIHRYDAAGDEPCGASREVVPPPAAHDARCAASSPAKDHSTVRYTVMLRDASSLAVGDTFHGGIVKSVAPLSRVLGVVVGDAERFEAAAGADPNVTHVERSGKVFLDGSPGGSHPCPHITLK